jgi:hypothetical protein
LEPFAVDGRSSGDPLTENVAGVFHIAPPTPPAALGAPPEWVSETAESAHDLPGLASALRRCAGGGGAVSPPAAAADAILMNTVEVSGLST